MVTPYFAIFTFAPTVFQNLKLDETAGTIFANTLAFIGAIVGMLTIEHLGRRQQLIGPFWIMAVALLVIGLWTGAPPMVTVAAFAVFAFFNAVAGNLTAVYPIELFPTEIRATGVGVVNAASRVGAAVGTFLLPVGIDAIGSAAVHGVRGRVLRRRRGGVAGARTRDDGQVAQRHRRLGRAHPEGVGGLGALQHPPGLHASSKRSKTQSSESRSTPSNSIPMVGSVRRKYRSCAACHHSSVRSPSPSS